MGHFFCLWLVMWSKMNPRNSSAPKDTAKCQKAGLSRRNARIILGSHSSMNLLSHPYQLIGHPRNASIRRFGGIFVPKNGRQRCFPLHCLRPLVSCCGSSCGSKRNSQLFDSASQYYPTNTNSILRKFCAAVNKKEYPYVYQDAVFPVHF